MWRKRASQALFGDCRQLCALPKRAAVGSTAALPFHESTLIAPHDAMFIRCQHAR
jgi:hypothetical protein